MKEKQIKINSDITEHKGSSTIESTRLINTYSDNQSTTENSPDSHWKKLNAQVLNKITKFIVDYFNSKIMSDETEKLHDSISAYLRKSKRWSSIRKNKELQDIFVLGYFHAFEQALELSKKHIISKEDELLLKAMKTYKYIEPCVFSLYSDHKLSHSDLAKRVNLSKTALSNFMSRINSYQIFDSTVIGRNRYYSLSQPNGQRILALIKKEQTPSIENDTAALTIILNNLIKVSHDDMSANEAVENCRQLVKHKTTKPSIILNQMNELSFILKSPRYPTTYVIEKEREVKKLVVIYTIDIESEKIAAPDIVNNIKNRGINYYYFISKGTKKTAKKHLKNCLNSYLDFNIPEMENLFNQRVQIINIDPKIQNIKINEMTEIVVHDLKDIYISKDKTIDENTLYIEPDDDEKKLIVEVISSKI